MEQPNHRKSMDPPLPEPTGATESDRRGVGILAQSLFRSMQEQGYSSAQIIGLSSALIELVRDDLRRPPG